jgi:hypothetical protein
MGATNVLAVMAMYPKLDHAAMRLLTHMAATSVDPGQRSSSPPCLYWATPESQMLAMGWRDMSIATANRRLRRLRGDLVAAGAAARVGVIYRHPVWMLITGSQPDLEEAVQWAATQQQLGPPRPGGGGSPWPG